MKYFLYIVCLLLAPNYLFAQQQKIDSLWKEYIKTDNDTIRCDMLGNLNKLYYYVDMDKAVFYVDSLCNVCKRVGPKYEAKAYQTKGVMLANLSRMDEAIKMFDKSLKIAMKVDDKALIASLYRIYGACYDRKENLKKADEYNLKSIRLNKSIGDDNANLESYLNMGMRETRREHYKESAEYLAKALRIAESTNNFNAAARVNGLISKNYTELKQFKKARGYLNEVYNLSKKYNNMRGLYQYYNDMRYLLAVQGKGPSELLPYLDSTLVYAKRIKSQERIQQVHLLIGEQHMKDGDLIKAEKHLNTALRICKKHKLESPVASILLVFGKLEALKGNKAKGLELVKSGKEKIGSIVDSIPSYSAKVKEAFAEVGDYELAYQELQSHYVKNDSVFRTNSSLKIEAMEQKYETEKKEKEILQYKAKQATQSNRVKLLGGSSLALLCTLGIFGFYYRRNKKQKDRIVALQKELHHRVDNNLAIVDEFIERTKETVSDKKLLDEMSSLQNRVGSINEVHRMLYQEDDITSINFKRYVQSLGEQVTSVFKRDDVQIELAISDKVRATTDKSVPLGLIINEFITNSFKYAFKNIPKPKISISASENQNELTVKLKDNGIGFDKNNSSKSKESYGTDIMSLLAKQMKATYLFDGNDGVSVTLQIPK